MTNVDARGLHCPQPVILTKKALEGIESGEVLTIVDNITARENLIRLAANLNCEYVVEEKDDLFYVKLKKAGASEEKKANDDFVIVITSDLMGAGDPELGRLLMTTYTYTLNEAKPYPKAVIFINSGVKLVVEGSDSLGNIQKLEDMGIEIISCGTCLDFYHLSDKLKVGIVGNMYTIVEYMNTAGRVVNIG